MNDSLTKEKEEGKKVVHITNGYKDSHTQFSLRVRWKLQLDLLYTKDKQRICKNEFKA